MSRLNLYLAPTVFVKPNHYLYVYYSNMKAISDIPAGMYIVQILNITLSKEIIKQLVKIN